MQPTDYSTLTWERYRTVADKKEETQQPRYDLATFARYARAMLHTPSVAITNQEVNLAYVIRLNRDQASGEWRILLKPVDGGEARLFGDVETALLYLEAVMQNEQR